MPGNLQNKEGCTYSLSYTAADAVSASNLTSSDIALCGVETQDEAEIENVIYDVKTNTVNIILADKKSYNRSYTVSVGSESFECAVMESKDAQAGTISVKNVTVNEDGTEAEIYIYNATYSEANKKLVGTNEIGQTAVSYPVVLPAESVYEITVTGTELQNLVWVITD